MAVDPSKIRQSTEPAASAMARREEYEARVAQAEENQGDMRTVNEFTSQLGAAGPAMIQDMALRQSGSSAMGGINVAIEEQNKPSAVPAFLDRFWMDDFRKGPIDPERQFTVDPLDLYTTAPVVGPALNTAAKALGLEPQVDIPKPLAGGAQKMWEYGLGKPAQGLGYGVGKLIEGLEWVSGATGYGLSYTPWYNDEVVARPSWDTAQELGFGDVWTLGTQTQTGNFSEYVAQQKRDWEAAQRNIENKDLLGMMGVALGVGQGGGDGVDIWAAEGYDTALAGAPIFVGEGFDPNNPDDMRALTEGDQGDRFNFTSGLAEAAGQWYLGAAPFKAVKWARSGSEVLGFSGVTSRNTAIGRVNAKAIDGETDDFIKYVQSGGKEGKMTSMGADAEALAAASYDEIGKFDWVKPKRGAGGTEAAVIQGVGAEITDPVTAAIFRAAMSGSAKYQTELVNRAGLVADAIARQRNLTVKMGSSEELLWLQKPNGLIINPLLKRNLDGLPDSALVDDAIRMADEFDILDKAGFAVEMAGMQGVRTAGTNTVWGKRVANAWRAGAAHRQENTLINKARGGTKTPENASYADRVTRLHNEGSAIEEWSFQVSKHFRPVGILNWVNTEKQTGWLVVRGADDTDAALEWNAAFAGSKTLVRDQEFKSRMLRVWGRASTEMEKMRAKDYIERAVVQRLANQYGVDNIAAAKAYKVIYGMREQSLNNLKGQAGKDVGFGFDPETGKLLLSSPNLVSQLESRIPILDFGLMEKTIRRMASKSYGDVFKARRAGETIEVSAFPHKLNAFADELNSVWKLNTLMRLGYTQRNLTEGWMRSLAYLGTLNNFGPEAIARGTGRLFTNTWKAGQRVKIAEQERAVGDIIKGTKALRDDVQRELDQITEKLNKAVTTTNQAVRRSQWLRAQKGLQDDLARYDNELDAYSSYMKMLSDKRWQNRHRRMLDDGDSAFAGIHGDLRRITSGADVNVNTLLQGRTARDLLTNLDDVSYRIIDPTDAQYWDELVTAGEQFAGDKLARIALSMTDDASREATLAKMVEYLQSKAGKADMRRLGYSTSLDDARHHADRVLRIVENYLPRQEARSLFLRQVSPTGDELAGVLSKSRLSPIHGREIELAASGGVAMKATKLQAQIKQGIFQFLGSKPESFLVRHPFYAEVYARRRAELIGLAKNQKREWTDELSESIEKSAHRYAQKTTTDIMFTIVRYSNSAALTRYLSPFFSAWENSMRTWGTIIARDPSTLMRGSFLWNLLNDMGSVYTYDGKKIAEDKWGFVTGEEQDGIIFLPGEWTEGIAEWTGGFVPGIPKGGLNVITPGDTPYLPGFGPGVIVPVQVLLAGKPDIQNTLHRAMGDKLYRQIAPFGRIQPFEWNQLLSSGQRKATVGALGDSNENWVKTVVGVQQNMLTDWYRAGGDPADKPSFVDFEVAANNWYKFNAIANYVLPVAVTRISKYRTELNAWRAMSRVMPYDEAMQRFEEMYPGAVALTVSSLERNTKNIRSDMESFDVVSRNKDIIDEYSTRGGGRSLSAASVLAAASMKGEWNPAAYDYFAKAKDPYTGDRYSTPWTSGEFSDEVTIKDGWREFSRVKMEVELAIEEGGITASEGKDALRRYALEQMPEDPRFGDTWKSAYQTYTETGPANLQMVASIASDEKFYNSPDGSTRTWELIRQYLETRQEVWQAKQEAPEGSDERKEITEAWERWKVKFRDSSLAFSDFYDAYFEGDDLTARLTYKPLEVN